MQNTTYKVGTVGELEALLERLKLQGEISQQTKLNCCGSGEFFARVEQSQLIVDEEFLESGDDGVWWCCHCHGECGESVKKHWSKDNLACCTKECAESCEPMPESEYDPADA